MLAPEFLPVWGGVGTYIVEIVRHMPKSTTIHVLTPMRKGFSEQSSSSDFDFSRYFGGNVHVHFISHANDTFFYNAKFLLACFREIPKLVKEEKIDLVHSHTAHMPDILVQNRNLKVPILTTIHTTIRGQREGTKSSGMSISNTEKSEKITFFAYPFLNLAETFYFRKKRYYITVSNWMKQQITRQYPGIDPSLISIIHNSVDTDHFSPGKSLPAGDMVLFTGRLVASKGVNCLVEAIPKVLKRYPKTSFVFIGPGNSSPYIAALKKLGVPEKNYSFLGYLKESSDLIAYYRASSVYVAPTLYENLPIRILEAMACGVPVVASNICAIPEAILDGSDGLLVNPGSVNELADAICQLLGNRPLRVKMGQNARKKMIEKFNLGLNIKKTENVYKRIIES